MPDGMDARRHHVVPVVCNQNPCHGLSPVERSEPPQLASGGATTAPTKGDAASQRATIPSVRLTSRRAALSAGVSGTASNRISGYSYATVPRLSL